MFLNFYRHKNVSYIYVIYCESKNSLSLLAGPQNAYLRFQGLEFAVTNTQCYRR